MSGGIAADTSTVGARLRQEAGFGLIELLMAMTILNVGVLAVVGALNAGIAAQKRAARIGTATTLADKQMELYRALTYDAVALASSSIATTDAVYQADSAYSTSQATTTCATPLPDSCIASRLVDGSTTPASPDGQKYRVDTYVIDDHPPTTYTPPAGRPHAVTRVVRKVTVVVRDGRKLNKVLARETSTFDCSTALPYGPGCPTA